MESYQHMIPGWTDLNAGIRLPGGGRASVLLHCLYGEGETPCNFIESCILGQDTASTPIMERFILQLVWPK
jgi:hypothetical protein